MIIIANAYSQIQTHVTVITIVEQLVLATQLHLVLKAALVRVDFREFILCV